MEPIPSIDLEFSFHNSSKDLKITSRKMNGEVTSFQMDKKEYINVPEIGTEVGREVHIQMRFTSTMIFQYIEDFENSNRVPDSITLNNGKASEDPAFKEITILMYPVRQAQYGNQVMPYSRIQLKCTNLKFSVFGCSHDGVIRRFFLADR